MTESGTASKKIVALVNDLMFASRIEGTLGAAGYTVRTVPDAATLLAVARESRPDGIVIGFGAPGLDWEGAIRAVRAEPALERIPLLAFGPHVDTAARAAATAAGATHVVTNGAFFNRMPRIVAELVGSRRREGD